MKFYGIFAAAFFVFASAANAFSWMSYDFGNQYFDEHNNTSDVSYPTHGFRPSPGSHGEGGGKFDIEGLNFAYDDVNIYISLTSSFGEFAHSTTWNSDYYAGDLFFGFDGDNDDFAIDWSERKLYSVSSWNYIPIRPGTYGNHGTVRNAVGAFTIASGTALGSVDKWFQFDPLLETSPMPLESSLTYMWEFRFAIADLGVDLSNYSTISFHNTLECGNDVLNKDFGLERNVVPEPTSVILLICGLLCLAIAFRRGI